MVLLRSFLLSFFILFANGVVAADTPVDINTADAATLASAIQGVGLSKAQAIVAYRDQYGRFTTIDELARVKGIGAKLVENNRTRLTVGSRVRQ